MEQTNLIRRARYGPNTILAAGMSRALNTALNSAESELLLLVLILDRDSGRILDAECNIILGINSDYIASLLVGRNFYQELDRDHPVHPAAVFRPGSAGADRLSEGCVLQDEGSAAPVPCRSESRAGALLLCLIGKKRQ